MDKQKADKMRKKQRKMRARANKRSQRAGKKPMFIGIGAGVAVLAIAGGLFGYYKVKTNLVYKEIYLEAGSEEPDISESMDREIRKGI